MATKSKITLKAGDETKTLDGYLVSNDIGLVNTDDGWITVHIRTGNKLVGPVGAWKMKRQALAFAEHLVAAVDRWDFDDEEGMFTVNDREEWNGVYLQAVEKGRAA